MPRRRQQGAPEDSAAALEVLREGKREINWIKLRRENLKEEKGGDSHFTPNVEVRISGVSWESS